MDRGFILPTQFLNEVEQILSWFYEKTGVAIVLLIDISGQLISYKGNAQGIDITSLSALVASDMAAVNEIARLIGEENRFKLLFHEGETHNILVSVVRGNFLMVTIFSASVQIGLVRLFSKETMNKLLKLVAQFETATTPVTNVVDADFTASLADELERAFGE